MNLLENDVVQIANRAIVEWLRDTDKLVVGVDGYPGAGKTSFVDNLLKLNPRILAVARDDFVIERSAFKKILDRSEDRSLPFEFDMLDLPRFREFIQTYKNSQDPRSNVGYNGVTGKIDVEKTYDFSKPILLVEGVFLFHAGLTNDLWDRRIFLKGDHTVIGERRVAREKARWGKEYFPENHPDSYFRLVMQAYDRYVDMQHPKEHADLVLDMTQ